MCHFSKNATHEDVNTDTYIPASVFGVMFLHFTAFREALSTKNCLIYQRMSLEDFWVALTY